MGMTMTQKILARCAGLPSVKAGQMIEGTVDFVLCNDIMTPVIADVFQKYAVAAVHDPDKIVMVLDHYTPCKDIKSAHLCARSRKFAADHGITQVYDVGRMGVEHALLPEEGFVAPGRVIVGADSHTCTYGALGAFSTGVGSTDAAAAMAAGRLWFQVPAALRVVLTGTMKPYVSGKDIILELIGRIGVEGARYKSLEFSGDGVAQLDMDDRFTICNMAIEAGAKNGIFPVDEKTLEYLSDKSVGDYQVHQADDDADYERVIEIDLDTLEPTAALPHLPSNTVRVSEVEEISVQQVVIGSCTNGRLKDLREAARILKGRTICPTVRCIIIPATQKVYRQAMHEGLIDIFLDAGAAVSTPTCGPCCGGHMGVMSEGECTVSTTNRNFIGRMGPTDSKIILASPAVAAASALTGVLTDPRACDEVEKYE